MNIESVTEGLDENSQTAAATTRTGIVSYKFIIPVNVPEDERKVLVAHHRQKAQFEMGRTIFQKLSDGRRYLVWFEPEQVNKRPIDLFQVFFSAAAEVEEFLQDAYVVLQNWQDAEVGEVCVMDCEYDETVARAANYATNDWRDFKPLYVGHERMKLWERTK